MAGRLAGTRRRPHVVRRDDPTAGGAGAAATARPATRCPSARAWTCCARPGLPVTDADRRAATPTAAVAAARPLGGRPVALKLDAVGLAHKSDLGRGRLGLAATTPSGRGRSALLEAGRRHGLDVRGLLVEPMADPGVELIVGLRRDPQFGPAVSSVSAAS